MDRNTVLWTIVVFFGATVMFGAIANVTEDESAGVRIGLQAVAGLILVGVIVAYRSEDAPMRPLADQTILITGSTDGHGRRVAEELVKDGASVLVHGRDPDKVARVTEEIGAARGLTADLARLDDVRRLAGEVDQLDTLVNNAGIVSPSAGRAPTATSSPSPSTTCPTSS